MIARTTGSRCRTIAGTPSAEWQARCPSGRTSPRPPDWSSLRPRGRRTGRVQCDASGRAATLSPRGTGPPEIRELARTLNDTAGRLEALLASQRAFVADASHQLRTPMTALHVWLDNAADVAGSPEIRHDLDRAREEVMRMDRLVAGC